MSLSVAAAVNNLQEQEKQEQQLRANDESTTAGRIDPLEEHAVFLSEFQSHYSFYKFGKIHTEEIAQVFEYRSLCDKLDELKEDEALLFRRLNNECSSSKTMNNPYETDIVSCQNEINRLESNDRLLHLDMLVERFQVWSTKALVQHLLLGHDHERNLDSDAECWSMLLNLPSASYMSGRLIPSTAKTDAKLQNVKENKPMTPFANIWNDIYNSQNHQCSLILPPNVYNFKEYARLTHMIAQLPTPAAARACRRSPFCRKPTRSTCAPKFFLRPYDLVALWTHAQRNGGALRQLMQMFVLERNDSDEHVNYNDKHRNMTTFRATFAGNHRLSHRKAVQESHLIDRIAAYAVLNQASMTRPKIMEAYQYQMQHQTQPDIWRTSLHRPAKRMRYPLNANEASLCGDDRVELLRACQLHLLYGLVDSHRRAVQSAIYAKRSQLINVLKCTRRDKAEVTEAEGLMMRLRRRRGELWSNPTLMHIARRLERGVCKEEVCDRLRKTADGEQVSDSIDAAVRQLLDMILKCAMHGEARDSGIERKDNIYQQAIDHWKAGYKTFTKKRDRYGLVAAARQLLSENDENAPEPASIAMCLRARPSPWFDKCVAVSCSSPISPELHDSEFLICANCNKAVHKKCGDKEEWCSAESRVRRQSLPEWKLILPTDAAMPDFREERAQVLRWSMKPIKLKRSVIDDSLELEPLGITFQDLEVCSQLLQDASLGNCLVTDLARVAVTYAADMKGLLVTEVVGGGVSERHGVRLGDVIVSVKVVDEDDSTNSVTKTNMEHMSLLERQESVLVDATDLEIIIRRPDAAVLEGLQKWRMGLEEANRYSLSEWRLIEQSYYCQICKDKVEEPEADVALPERVFRIARAMRSYDNCASLVGSSVFILPDDPFFDAIQRELRKVNISFDHLNRPVELLILAFVPSSIDVEAHDRDAPSGTFFLLPIVSYEQLKLLGPLCKPRQIFAGTLDAQTLKSWTKDELLDLTGVMKLPFEDVHQMLAQTELMHDAVAVRVATLASCTCRDALEPHDDHESDRSRPHFPCTCNLADFGVPRYTPTLRGSFHILDDMFSSRAPHLMRLLHKTEEPIDMDGIANLDEELPYITPHPVKGIAGACNTQCSTIHPHSDCRIFFSDIQAESGSLVDAGDPRCDSVRKLEKKFVVLHLNSVLCNASWGFEIVQWRNDSNRLRVGRLKEQSPAYQQGVPANAILLAINGLDIQSLVRDAHALSSAMRGVAATASTGSVASERRIVLHIQEPVQPTEDSVITASLSKKFAVPIEGSLSGTSANDNGLKAGATLATINETLARPDSDKRLVHASLCQATDQSAPFSQSPELEVNIIYPKNIYAGQLERLYTDLWSIAEGEHLNPPHDRYLMHCSDPRTESLTYGPDCDMTIKKSKNSQLLCGYGWGLEIVKWESDTDAECRIGRINTESDAFKAGLRPNDVVLAVNCKPIDKFQNNGELAAAVLRIPYSASWSQSSDVMSSIVRKEVSHPSATILILKVRQPSHLPLPGPVNAHKPIAWIEPINPHAIDAAAASKTTGRIIDLTADDDIHKNMDGVCFPFLTAVARCKNVHDDLIKEATLLQKRVVFRDARSICLDDLTLAPWDSNVSFSTTEVR
ncbi:hypothetical protein MPSEU_000881000 [Mayamaea pseudoterrestris]|nr:hypothetical protein MPSEU_000881000 [Mayamaea pseudoterrestris]